MRKVQVVPVVAALRAVAKASEGGQGVISLVLDGVVEDEDELGAKTP